MNKFEAVKSYILAEWSNDLIIKTWNKCCNQEDFIYDNIDSELDIQFNSPSCLARAINNGDYHYNDSYFFINGYGNLVSLDYAEEGNCPLDLDTIVDYVIGKSDANLPEINNDYLIEAFAEEYLKDLTCVTMCNIINEINERIEDSNLSLLTEDWDELANDLIMPFKD